MSFLSDPSFWILSAGTLAAAVIPARLRSISLRAAAAFALGWAGMAAAVLLFHGAFAAAIAGGVSLTCGLILFLATLISSGIESMMKKRYETR